jgi:hypothetical protein
MQKSDSHIAMTTKLSFSIIFLLLFLTSGLLKAQLVNVESQRLQNDTTRFAGIIKASFSYQQNNNSILSQLNGSATLQVRSKSLKDIFLLLGSYDLVKSNSSQLSNAGFVHYRYTHKFNRFFRWEAFTQYQNNEVLLLDRRLLIGTGPRFKILNKPNLKSSLGTLYMFENEKTSELIPQIHNDHRMSSYFTFTYSFAGNLCEINTITYYQPVLNNFADCRITNQTSISFNFKKHISFEIGVKYLYDSSPPQGVINNTFSSNMGIKAGF